MSGFTRRNLFKGGVVAAAAVLTPAVAEAASASPGPKPAVTKPTPIPLPKIISPDVTQASTALPVGAVSSTNTQLNGLTGWVVPSDWGGSWRAKLNAAKAGSSLAVAALVGDSVGFGYWASNLFSTSWFEMLRDDLVAVGGYGGSGFQSQAHSPSVMYNPNSGVPALYKTQGGNVWQQSAGWTPLVAPRIYGPGGGTLQCTTSGATIFNYVIGTELGIWYYDGGADFTVQIDGQSVGTVHVGTSNLPTHVVFPAPGGVSGIHSWQITGNYNPTTSTGTAICGVEGLCPTGVRLDNFSFPGLYSRAFANQDAPYYSGTYAGGWKNPADLIIYELAGIDLGGGDPNYPSGVPADVWAQNVQSYLQGVMNTTYGGNSLGKTDVLFVFPAVNSSGDTHILAMEYKARALGIAQSYGAALLDMNAMWHGSWNAWQQAGYAGDQADPTKSGTDFNHPSDAGHAWMAAQINQLLGALA